MSENTIKYLNFLDWRCLKSRAVCRAFPLWYGLKCVHVYQWIVAVILMEDCQPLSHTCYYIYWEWGIYSCIELITASSLTWLFSCVHEPALCSGALNRWISEPCGEQAALFFHVLTDQQSKKKTNKQTKKPQIWRTQLYKVEKGRSKHLQQLKQGNVRYFHMKIDQIRYFLQSE